MEIISKQLTSSRRPGQLGPETRLGVAVSEFAQVLDDGRKRQFREMQSAGILQLTGQDAIRVTEELNRDSERLHHTWRPYGTKCGVFLDRLQRLAGIGDVVIGGSQNIIAASVWCAVRMSLMTATSFLGYFQKLSDLFMMLGTSWDLHQDFAQLFPRSEVLQSYLCEYLIILMRLCRKAVLFGNRSYAGQLFSSLAVSFETEFGPLQRELDQWGLMIQLKANHLAAACIVDTEKTKNNNQKQRLLQFLSPNQRQHATTWRRHRRKGNCKWIYQNAAYKAWRSRDNLSGTLCISGKLGSGKTVILANLVAHVNIEQQPCAYFFCAFNEPDSLRSATILGSIASQIIDYVPAGEMTWNDISAGAMGGDRFTAEEAIMTLLKLVPDDKTYVIIIDGLEDCPDEDINDVLHGIRRLMDSRKILFCYSARSGSRFRRWGSREFATTDQEFTISLDEQRHDDEIEAYIIEEMARRKESSSSAYLSDELEELVKRQLIEGAQGMYLWVTLQLDAIFPSYAKTIITEERLVGLLENLPKSLPDAFDRALEGIADTRYQDTIMKLVMAAPSPLSLDELRAALTITPGDPTWHAARVPTDGAQLVALCGGSLLELDDEDDKIRFIHHSVVLHILSPPAKENLLNARTSLYHFSLEDAEVLSGSLCVTYLNMPIFDTRVATTRKMAADHLASNVVKTARREKPIVARLATHFKSKSRGNSSQRPVHFDIGRIASEIQAERLRDGGFDPRCLQDYAVRNWLLHSRGFREETNPACSSSWDLWIRLVHGYVDVARVPFESPLEHSFPALAWAIANNHEALFLDILSDPKTEPSDAESLSRSITSFLKSIPQDYNTEWLGHIFTQLIKLAVDDPISSHYYSNKSGHYSPDPTTRSLPNMADDYSLGLASSLQDLLECGVDPTVPHFRTGKEPLQMLIGAMSCASIDQHSPEAGLLYTILDNVMSREEASESLQSSWVPRMLRDIVDRGKENTLRRILVHQPSLQIDWPEDSLVGTAVARRNIAIATDLLRAGASASAGSYIENKPAIQLALETRQRDMVGLLARHGGILEAHMTPEPCAGGHQIQSAHPSLLRMAIEQMGSDWVCLLLRLGADPNGGGGPQWDAGTDFSTAQRHNGLKDAQLEILSPLQAAMARNETSMCLDLMERGASIFPPTGPRPLDMAMENQNLILLGKLTEIQGEHTSPVTKVKPGIPAFLSACRILSQVISEPSFEDQYLVDMKIHPQASERELVDILTQLQTTATERDFYHRDHPGGNTALHYLTGGMENFNSTALLVAESVLARQPDLISARNDKGETPLDRAIFRGSTHGWRLAYLESLYFLVDKWKASDGHVRSRTKPDASSMNALCIAISCSSPVDPVVRRLLRAGTDPNAGRSPFTALELAIQAEDEDYALAVVTLLLRHGANPFGRVAGGGSVLDCARRMKRTGLEVVLKESMMRIQEGKF